MNTISFKEAIRLVHPDTNPNIINSGEKVHAIMAVKTDEKKLYSLLNGWGLIGEAPKEPEIKFEKITLMRNTIYNGMVMVNVKGLGNCIVQRTTNKRVYFHEMTKQQTGRTFCSFEKINFAIKATQ